MNEDERMELHIERESKLNKINTEISKLYIEYEKYLKE